MARVPGEGPERLYQLHHRWIHEVLPADGSLIDVSGVWSPEQLDELVEHFIGEPDETKDKKFLEKLHDQLAGCSPQAVQLMAELHVVHFLHIFNGAISATKKQSDVETVLSWMPTPPSLPTEVVETFSPGLIHPGQWVLSRRDTQLTWLIRFAAAWLRLAPGDREELLRAPWGFKVFVNEVDAPSADGARLAMLHMTFPDVFDPIVTNDHKAAIASRFADLAGDDPDIDRQLLSIRQALTPPSGEWLDWYQGNVHLRWSKGRKWKPFLTWIARFRALPDFDAAERDYKIESAAQLQATRDLVIVDDAGWPDALKRCFTQTNITRWTVHDRFLRWVKADPTAAKAALSAIWSDGKPATERLREFIDAVPSDVLSNRGERLNIGSFLLMADGAEQHPPFKVSLVRKGFRLVGWPSDDGLDDVEAYVRAQLLFEEIYQQGRDWDVPLRDPLDAQGALWALTSYEQRPESWSDELWDELQAYRVDQGEGLETEPPGAEEPDAKDSTAGSGQVDHLAQAAKDLHVDREHLDEIVALLEDKGQVVLYGPPGTGKTFLALRLARAIAAGDERRVSLVQFHPATTYEDFIEGLRPKLTPAGQVTYTVVPGPLVRIAEEARKEPEQHFVLVVDEINRANLPKVFGELLFLLEYRHERARTIHRPDEPFGLPENLWIIGTMNTADRSIALIDAAMRRRFHFLPFFPHQGPMRHLLRRWLDTRNGRRGVADLLDAVNEELLEDVGDHLLIGPSHFMRTDLSDKALEQIWTYNVFPLIEEQYWGDRDAIDRWRWPQVHRRFSVQLDGQEAADVDAPPSSHDESSDEDGSAAKDESTS